MSKIWSRNAVLSSAGKPFGYGSTVSGIILQIAFDGTRPRPNDKWHLDEVVITTGGVKHWLWRAADADGDVLDILIQPRRNAKAAKRFLARLIARFGAPRVAITDKLRRYIKRRSKLSHRC